MVFAFQFVNYRPVIIHSVNTSNLPMATNTSELVAYGHQNFDYHQYQIDTNPDDNLKYLNIMLSAMHSYYYDPNGTGEPLPNSYGYVLKRNLTLLAINKNDSGMYLPSIVDLNDTNVKLLKIAPGHDFDVLTINPIDGEISVYLNDNLEGSLAAPLNILRNQINHNDILRIEYNNTTYNVSHTLTYKILTENVVDYIPRETVDTMSNSLMRNITLRYTQPIWYLENNVITINLLKLMDTDFVFYNPDSDPQYIKYTPRYVGSTGDAKYPEIAIPYQSGMKLKWKGLNWIQTPGSTSGQPVRLETQQYFEESTGMFGETIAAGWRFSGTTSGITPEIEYDIVDGNPNGGPTHSGTRILFEHEQTAGTYTGFKIYFHKVRDEVLNEIPNETSNEPTSGAIQSATEQFYDYGYASSVTIYPYTIENGQLKFLYDGGSSSHYAPLGTSLEGYYLYVADNVNSLRFSGDFSLTYSIGNGDKFRGTDWNIGDTIEISSNGDVIFKLVLTDNYSLGYVGAGLPVPPIYTDEDIWIYSSNDGGYVGNDQTLMRIYEDTATTMTFMGIPTNQVLERGLNYYLVVPDDQNVIRMIYMYYIWNETKSTWWNTGVNNSSAYGRNNRGSKWDTGDVLKVANNSSLTDPVYLTITNVSVAQQQTQLLNSLVALQVNNNDRVVRVDDPPIAVGTALQAGGTISGLTIQNGNTIPDTPFTVQEDERGVPYISYGMDEDNASNSGGIKLVGGQRLDAWLIKMSVYDNGNTAPTLENYSSPWTTILMEDNQNAHALRFDYNFNNTKIRLRDPGTPKLQEFDFSFVPGTIYHIYINLSQDTQLNGNARIYIMDGTTTTMFDATEFTNFPSGYTKGYLYLPNLHRQWGLVAGQNEQLKFIPRVYGMLTFEDQHSGSGGDYSRYPTITDIEAIVNN